MADRTFAWMPMRITRTRHRLQQLTYVCSCCCLAVCLCVCMVIVEEICASTNSRYHRMGCTGTNEQKNKSTYTHIQERKNERTKQIAAISFWSGWSSMIYTSFVGNAEKVQLCFSCYCQYSIHRLSRIRTRTKSNRNPKKIY